MGGRWILCLITLLAGLSASAQRIVYSEPDKEDNRRINFEVIGKMNGNFLIYKTLRNKSWISILDNNMKVVANVDQDYLPNVERVINVDFFAYTDFSYMIYQYRKKGIVYCVAAKIDPMGQKIGELMALDTTEIGGGGDSKIYSVLSSEDKSKIIVFKINKKDRKNFMVTTLLMDDKLQLIKKTRFAIPMQDRDDDYLSEFQLDNDGDLIFSKFNRVNNENVGEASFIVKYAQADTLLEHPLKTDKVFLDEIRIKPDNINKRYFLTSFYTKQKRGNTEGYYFYVWDKKTQQVVIEDTASFTETLRREARGNASVKAAFNDYFIRQIVTRRDGGFVIASEAYYTTSRGSNMWNRWNYMYSPYFRSYDYYYYSPYYNNSFWGNRYYDYQNTRYQADNITIQSFDQNGKREWSSVITKEQFDDQTEDLISYQIMNTGGQVHFLFNNLERRIQLLTDFSLKPDGELTRNPTLKDLDKGYEFMPKYGKQVSARQMIIPCIYRNYICFAKLEY
jgi:hypothetical protein